MVRYPYLTRTRGQTLVEVTDRRDRPLLLMSGAEVRRRSLPHRVVLVLLRDMRGRVLVARGGADGGSGLWRVSAAGQVLAGEAREDAARRLLALHLGIGGVQLAPRAALAASAATGFRQVSLYVAGPAAEVPVPASDLIAQTMFLDRDELTGLADHFPEMLSSDLLWAVRSGYVFPAARVSRSA